MLALPSNKFGPDPKNLTNILLPFFPLSRPPLPHDIDNVKEAIKSSTFIRPTSEQNGQLASSELNPTSPLYDSDTESELYQGVVSPRVASGVMSRLAPEQISPPSSPEAAAWGNS